MHLNLTQAARPLSYKFDLDDAAEHDAVQILSRSLQVFTYGGIDH